MKQLNLKMSLLLLAAVVIFSQTARAESTSAFDWTGLYAGIHIGGALGSGSMDFPTTDVDEGLQGPFLAPGKLHTDPGGILGGGQIGYNLQKGKFVFGIQADISRTEMSGSNSSSPLIAADGTSNPGSITASENIDWLGTVRPRLGYTLTPNLLVYGTGGLAYGRVNYSSNIVIIESEGTSHAGARVGGGVGTPPPGGPSFPASFSNTQTGWTVGAGVEYAIGNHWSLLAEYLYCDLGSASATAGVVPAFFGPASLRYNFDNTTFNIVNFAVNYKF